MPSASCWMTGQCRATVLPPDGNFTPVGVCCPATSRSTSTSTLRGSRLRPWAAPRASGAGPWNGEGTMAPKRKEQPHAAETLVTDAAETNGSYLVAVPQDLFLRLAAIAARSGLTTEDFVVATLERIAPPHDLNIAPHAAHL